jgi:inorganic pyrophosphatase
MSEYTNITTLITTTPNIEELQTKCFNTITELFEKYKNLTKRIMTHCSLV